MSPLNLLRNAHVSQICWSSVEAPLLHGESILRLSICGLRTANDALSVSLRPSFVLTGYLATSVKTLLVDTEALRDGRNRLKQGSS
jgi:hypothetical protein